MINIEIPGYGNLYIENVLMDYNGTIASGGKLISSLKNIIEKLSNKANLYVITADTFGTVSRELENLPIEIIKIKKNDERLKN
jgi:soluble P-type ATPase